MKINDIDISIYNASQLKVDIQNNSIVNNCNWVENSLSPIFAYNTIGFKKIAVTLLFKGTTRDAILTNISNLFSLLLKPIILDLDGYTHKFKAILSQDSGETTKTKSKYRYTKELVFLGYEYSAEVTETITSSQTFTTGGNIDTPINKLTIKPMSDITALNIEGLTDIPITVNNLTSNNNITFDFTTDIPTCKQGTTSKIADVTLWEVPKLKVGTNIVSIDNANCSVEITYNPRFI